MSEKIETNIPVVVVHDDGPLAQFLDTGKFGQIQRVASMFAQSKMVPEQYRGNVADCVIAIESAARMNLSPIMYMQNTYIVHGRPGIEAKLAIALINSSGLFEGNLEFEVEGDDPLKDDYRVRAYAVRKKDGQTIFGPWVTWQMVKAEKWDTKNGSKWNTIPGLMFEYRAAAFFGRTKCPEVLLGFQTVEELVDVGSEGFAPISETFQEEKASNLIQLKDKREEPEEAVVEEKPKRKKRQSKKADPEAAEEAIEEPEVAEEQPEQDEAPVEDEGAEMSVSEMRQSISDLLAEKYKGDVDAMNRGFVKALDGVDGADEATVERLHEIPEEHLPFVLDLVEAHCQGAA